MRWPWGLGGLLLDYSEEVFELLWDKFPEEIRKRLLEDVYNTVYLTDNIYYGRMNSRRVDWLLSNISASNREKILLEEHEHGGDNIEHYTSFHLAVRFGHTSIIPILWKYANSKVRKVFMEKRMSKLVKYLSYYCYSEGLENIMKGKSVKLEEFYYHVEDCYLPNRKYIPNRKYMPMILK